MKMKFEYELTKEDLIDFNLFHIMYAKSTRRSAYIQRYILSLLLIVIPIFLGQWSIVRFEYGLAIFLAFYVYWVVFYPRRLRKIVSKRITKLLNDGEKNIVIGAHSLSISEEGIVDQSKHTKAKTRFKEIEDILENNAHIYIYVSENSAHIIPLRIFLNEAEKHDFLALIQQKIGRKAGTA